MNPLDMQGVQFSIEMMNPNPTSSKTKDGPKYRISFEVEREIWDCFMDAKTNGMVLGGILAVTALGSSQEPSEPRPKGGPVSRAAAMLCQDELANQFAQTCGYADFKDMIYKRCEVSSRAELDHDAAAKAKYDTIVHQYAASML